MTIFFLLIFCWTVSDFNAWDEEFNFLAEDWIKKYSTIPSPQFVFL